MTEMCVADNGLINPAAFIAKSADLDTTKITGAADDIRAMGTSVDTQTDRIKASWKGLTGCYEAPEQAEVYALMDEPAVASQDLKDTFDKMAGHLDTYASDLDGIKPDLADLERRAQAFRDEVIDGVWVDASEAKDASAGEQAKGLFDWVPGVDEEKKKVPWYEDGDTVAKNNAFLDEVAKINERISTAASTCATSINGLTSLPADQKTITPIPWQAFVDPEQPMPWGNPSEEDRNCTESVGHGFYEFGKNTVQGLGALISYNPETGWGDWGYAGQAWTGLGNLGMSLAMIGPASALVIGIGHATGNGDNAVVNWMEDRYMVVGTAGASLVGIDLTAKDPFHKWKDDAVATGTESVLNIGTLFIPVGGQVAAGLKAGGMGARIARIAGAVTDFAVPGGSWLVKGGLRGVQSLSSIFRFADQVPVGAVDDVARAGARVPTFNPNALIDLVDDVPAPTRMPERPVTDTIFGDRPTAPDVGQGGGSRPGTTTPGGGAAEPPAGHGGADRPGGGRADDPTPDTRPEQPDGVEPTDPTSPVEAVDPARPGDTTPQQPGATDPTRPVDPVDPARPGDTTPQQPGATDPISPVDPVDPARHGETTPQQPGGPDPADSSRPADPDQPGQPTDDWNAMDRTQVTERIEQIVGSGERVSLARFDEMPPAVRQELLAHLDSVHPRADGPDSMQTLLDDMADPDSASGQALRDALEKSDGHELVDPDALSESGLTNSGRLIDGTVPPELQSLIDNGTVVNDGGVMRLAEPVRIEFDSAALRRNPAEAARQLTAQGQGLSQLTGGRWTDNFLDYRPGQKRVDPPFHTQVREQLQAMRARQLESLGFDDAAATAAARTEYEGLALLHSPDRIAGGDVFGFTGMGDARVNSAIGPGWRGSRRDQLFNLVQTQLGRIPEQYWGDVRLNVQLIGPR